MRWIASRRQRSSLGLATEWIEMLKMEVVYNKVYVSVLRPSGLKYCGKCNTRKEKGLGLATEWIEILYLHDWDVWQEVSVLRPSGLKLNWRFHCFPSCCLGLATEWIEIIASVPKLLLQYCLGLATEWIEMDMVRKNTVLKMVSVLRPSGLK